MSLSMTTTCAMAPVASTSKAVVRPRASGFSPVARVPVVASPMRAARAASAAPSVVVAQAGTREAGSREPDQTTKAIGAAYVVGVLALVDVAYWAGNEGAFIDFLQFVTKTLLGGHLICAFLAAVRSEQSPGAGTDLKDNAVRAAAQGALFGPLYILKNNEFDAEEEAARQAGK